MEEEEETTGEVDQKKENDKGEESEDSEHEFLSSKLKKGKKKQQADILNRISTKQFSTEIKDELERRTFHSLRKAISPKIQGHLFECFLIVGYPPDVPVNRNEKKSKVKPEVLYTFPEDYPGVEQVPFFCLPNDIQPDVVPFPRIPYEMKKRLSRKTISKLAQAKHSYVFIITTEDTLLYGFCVSYKELLSFSTRSSLFRTPAYNPQSFSKDDNKYDMYAPRVYCLLSRFPFFEIHFNFLYSILEMERKYCKSLLGSIAKGMKERKNYNPHRDSHPLNASVTSQHPSSGPLISPRYSKDLASSGSLGFVKPRSIKERCQAAEELLELARRQKEAKQMASRKLKSRKIVAPQKRSLTRADRSQSHAVLIRPFFRSHQEMESEEEGEDTADSEALELLKKYYDTRLDYESVFVELPCVDSPTVFPLPHGNEETFLADHCLALTLRLFSIDELINILRALMLEFSILVVCKNLGVLSSVVLSFIPLIRPFVWEGPFIPILPRRLSVCVEAPVPYIIGIDKLSKKQRRNLGETTLFIDLDNEVFSLPKTKLDELPNERELKRKLRQHHSVIHTPLKQLSLQAKSEYVYKHTSKVTPTELNAVHAIVRDFNDYQYGLVAGIIQKAHIFSIANSNPGLSPEDCDNYGPLLQRPQLKIQEDTEVVPHTGLLHLPSSVFHLSVCVFDFSDLDSLRNIPYLYSYSESHFMSKFLFTQHFAGYAEYLIPCDVVVSDDERTRCNTITSNNAQKFKKLLNEIVEKESHQKMMGIALLNIYDTIPNNDLQSTQREDVEAALLHSQKRLDTYQQALHNVSILLNEDVKPLPTQP